MASLAPSLALGVLDLRNKLYRNETRGKSLRDMFLVQEVNENIELSQKNLEDTHSFYFLKLFSSRIFLSYSLDVKPF